MEGPGHTCHSMEGEIAVRPATLRDMVGVKKLIEPAAGRRAVMQQEDVAYFESVREYVVVENSRSEIVGCGQVHFLWRDLAEIRNVVVAPAYQGRGVGSMILSTLLDICYELGAERAFCLTSETELFKRHGFMPIEGQQVAAEVYAELLRSYSDSVAEFLDLERVTPNILGLTRMLAVL